MKKIYTTLVAVFAIVQISYAQNTFPATGNVGIGTTSPGSLLEVLGTTSTPLTITRSTASSNVGMEFKNTTTSWFTGQAATGNFGISTISNLGTSTLFNITPGGNVGVGTISPSISA